MIFGYNQKTGQLISRENDRGAKINFTYHTNGERQKTIFPTGYTIERKIDEKGKILEILDGFDVQKSYAYDTYDRVTTIRTVVGSTQFTYDDGGDLRMVLDSRGFATSYDYDKQHNLRKVADAEGGVSSYKLVPLTN